MLIVWVGFEVELGRSQTVLGETQRQLRHANDALKGEDGEREERPSLQMKELEVVNEEGAADSRSSSRGEEKEEVIESFTFKSLQEQLMQVLIIFNYFLN